MTVAATVAGAISMLAQFGFFFGGGRDRDNPLGPDRRAARGALRAAGRAADPDDDQPDPRVFRRPARRRDQRRPARRSPARCARSPAYARRIPMPSAERNPASAPLFIINPLTGARMDNLFSTHPNVENRIRALEAMAGAMRAARPAHCGRARSRPSGADAVTRAGPRRPPGGGGAARGRPRPRTQPRRPGRGRAARSAALAPAERARAQALAAGDAAPPRADRRACSRGFLARRPPAAGADTRCASRWRRCTSTACRPHAAVDGAVRLARAGAERPAAGRARQRGGAPGRRRRRRRSGTPRPRRAARLAGPAARRRLGRRRGRRRSPPRTGAGAPIDLTLARPEEAGALGRGARRRGAADRQPAARPAGAQVSALPGFDEGAWWVQDAAAALPARLLGDLAGRRALDLCAAPGGKTLQLAAAGAEVTALDLSEPRLGRLRENLARTGLAAEIVVADALAWDAGAALRRGPRRRALHRHRHHPPPPGPAAPARRPRARARSWRCRRRSSRRAWGWLAPGGRLVYCVCSLLPEPRARRSSRAFSRDDARGARSCAPTLRRSASSPAGSTPPAALRLRPDFWPERGGMDGFYRRLPCEKPARSAA